MPDIISPEGNISDYTVMEENISLSVVINDSLRTSEQEAKPYHI